MGGKNFGAHTPLPYGQRAPFALTGEKKTRNLRVFLFYRSTAPWSAEVTMRE